MERHAGNKAEDPQAGNQAAGSPAGPGVGPERAIGTPEEAAGEIASTTARRRLAVRRTAVAYARGVAGGLLVGVPMLMTSEMWIAGFAMPPWRLLQFFLINYLILLMLEYYTGFQDEGDWWVVAQDAVVAYGIGIVVAALLLLAFDLIHPGLSLRETVGIIALEAIPVSIGAVIAISLLGQQREQGSERRKREAGFWGQQAIALGGAVVFGFNVAPTMEPVIVGYSMTPWHTMAVLLLSLVQMHAIVYGLEFRGSYRQPEETPWYQVFLEKGTISYAASLLVAAYLLWTFGRIGVGMAAAPAVHLIVALGYVTSLGAAAGKLVT
ncbi:MAG TPA: TIGR02587 family membrane protein [Trueperaceae bacterium]